MIVCPSWVKARDLIETHDGVDRVGMYRPKAGWWQSTPVRIWTSLVSQL